MQRIATWLLVALAVVVFAAAGYVIEHNDDIANGGATPSTSPVSVSGTTNSAPGSGTATPSTSSVSTVEEIVAFLGDDWTKGLGATSTSKRFTTLMSKDLHLRERNFGIDGSGYAKSPPGGHAYADDVKAVAATHPAVVVVSGGRNDVGDDPATAAARAKALFARLHARLPGVLLVAVAPMWGDSDHPAPLTALATAIKSGVTAVGGTYLDLPDPVHGHPDYMSDGADPNDKGYAAIAKALEPLLKPLVSNG